MTGRQRCGWTREGSSSSVLFQFLVRRRFAVMRLYACRDPGRERAFLFFSPFFLFFSLLPFPFFPFVFLHSFSLFCFPFLNFVFLPFYFLFFCLFFSFFFLLMFSFFSFFFFPLSLCCPFVVPFCFSFFFFCGGTNTTSRKLHEDLTTRD